MSNKSVNQELFEEPYRFEFFQAVRLLEKIFPERMPIGREASVTREIIRFRSRLALDFPASRLRLTPYPGHTSPPERSRL